MSFMEYGLIALASSAIGMLYMVYSIRSKKHTKPKGDKPGFFAGCMFTACLLSTAYAYALHTGQVFTTQAVQKIAFEQAPEPYAQDELTQLISSYQGK